MKKNYVVMDGNTAAAYSAYAFTEVAAIYPITPSSPMAEKVDEWSAKGKKNLFGSTVDVIQKMCIRDRHNMHLLTFVLFGSGIRT